jgi:hypothetical protein
LENDNYIECGAGTSAHIVVYGVIISSVHHSRTQGSRAGPTSIKCVPPRGKSQSISTQGRLPFLARKREVSGEERWSARDLPFGLPEKTSLDYQKVFESVVPLGQTDGLEKKRKNNGGSRAL